MELIGKNCVRSCGHKDKNMQSIGKSCGQVDKTMLGSKSSSSYTLKSGQRSKSMLMSDVKGDKNYN